jgi:alcohol dehydrogenase (NADP+)
MYEPLRHWGATKPGVEMVIGVAGIGGLGTMGIKIAKALGHKVVAISQSMKKE